MDHVTEKPSLELMSLQELADVSAEYPDIDPLALNVYNELTRSMRMLLAQLDKSAQMRPSGLSAGRNAVLWCVTRYPGAEGITPAEIADALDVTRATVTGLLSALEKDGLVERFPSSEDRRRIHVRPTPKARKVIAAEWPRASTDISVAMSELTERDKQQLLKLLAKVRRGARSVPADSGRP
jgi:MarR family transcriptional repressor of emrRAB